MYHSRNRSLLLSHTASQFSILSPAQSFNVAELYSLSVLKCITVLLPQWFSVAGSHNLPGFKIHHSRSRSVSLGHTIFQLKKESLPQSFSVAGSHNLPV